MTRAAVPDYLQQIDYAKASPGMRFGVFLRIWQDRDWQKDEQALKQQNDPNLGLRQTATFNEVHKAMLQELNRRQQLVFDHAVPDYRSGMRIETKSTAPFMTGMGYEHPLENGFAFLNPYGLPYLPGSSIKGVLRRAAQELASGAWGDSFDWSEEKTYSSQTHRFSIMDILFGLEDSEENTCSALRGVLKFWDVYPRFSGNMQIEVMTPHHTDYYQNGKAPHDCGMPNPITFLSVPMDSHFCFHIQCDMNRLHRLAPDLAEDAKWQMLIEHAMNHASRWLGFGAKTSVGYGALRMDTKALQLRQAQNAKQEEEARLSQMSPFDRSFDILKKMVDEDRQKKYPEFMNKKTNAKLWEQLKQLVGMAVDESMQNKAKVRELFDEILKYLGVDSKSAAAKKLRSQLNG